MKHIVKINVKFEEGGVYSAGIYIRQVGEEYKLVKVVTHDNLMKIYKLSIEWVLDNYSVLMIFPYHQDNDFFKGLAEFKMVKECLLPDYTSFVNISR